MKNGRNLLAARVRRINTQFQRDISALDKDMCTAKEDELEHVKAAYMELLAKLQNDLHEVHIDAHKQRICGCGEILQS